MRSPWSARTLSTVLPTVFGGCASHRHSRLNQSYFAVLGSKTTPTHLNFSSDDTGVLSSGMADYPFVFQACYLTLTSIAEYLGPLEVLPDQCTFGLELYDEYEPITDKPVSVKIPDLIPVDLKGNPLAYIDQLYSQEIPTAPSRRIIKWDWRPHKKPSSLIYSFLMAQYGLKIERYGKNTVTLPVDILDLKEFNLCPAPDVLEGSCAFILASGLYIATRASDKINRQKFWRYVGNATRTLSGYLSRMFQHPIAAKTLEACMLQSMATPGRAGAYSAADRLADMLRALCQDALKTKRWQNNLTLFLFEDYGPTVSMHTQAHALLMLAMQDAPRGRWKLTRRQVEGLKATFLVNSVPWETPRLYARTLGELRSEVDQRYSAPGAGRFHCAYVPAMPKVAIRALRTIKRRKPDTLATTPPPMSKKAHKVTYKVVSLEGQLIPQCTHLEDSSGVRHANLLFDSVRRRRGFMTSLYSDWAYILHRDKQIINNSTVITIGVGAGGSSRASLELGASKVRGIDIRSSFPAIPQREASYKPIEVVSSGHAQRFSWHEHVWKHGGDFRTLKSVKKDSVIILDLDWSMKEIDPYLNVLCTGKLVYVRFRACEEWLRYFISRCKPIRVERMSQHPALVHHTYIASCRGIDIGQHTGNFMTIEIQTNPYSSYDIQYDLNEAKAYVCNQLRICPMTLGGLDRAHLEEKIKRLRTCLVDMDNSESDNLKRQIAVLKDVLACLEPPYLMTQELISRLSPTCIRVLGRILGPVLTSGKLRSDLLR
uniref:Uncharacterized protein n=1 Tax=Narnavirus sp. TaxID=2587225 RepID=A0A514CZR9_9VIRU|nr:MAG: hypothetical protein H2Rhizo33183_000002 [Narnavirus sp.]